MQTLIIAGTVGRDAELRRTNNGDSVLSWSIAVDNGKDKQGNKREATWFDCSMWGQRAESLERHIKKGGKFTVSGRPTAREHNGKVYLGVNVHEVTFMGGGQREERQQYDQSPEGYGGSANGARTGGVRDLDDEIPFACDVRL